MRKYKEPIENSISKKDTSLLKKTTQVIIKPFDKMHFLTP